MSPPIWRSRPWRGGAAPQARPALGGRLGADRGCRLSGRAAGDPRCAGAPARRQADARGAGPGRAAGAAESGLAVVAFAETSWNEARRFLPILGGAALRRQSAPMRGSSPGDDSLIERLGRARCGDEALALLKTVGGRGGGDILRLPRRDRPAAPAFRDGHGFADGGRTAAGARKPAADRSAADVARRGDQRCLDRHAAGECRPVAAAGAAS